MEHIVNFITFKQEHNEEDARAALEAICLETEDGYVCDALLTQRYFKILHSQLIQARDDDLDYVVLIFKALLAACKTPGGLYCLKESHLSIELYSDLPEKFNIENWGKQQKQKYVLLFKILKYISKGHDFSYLNFLLCTILDRVTSAYLLQNKCPEISVNALECLLNICRANLNLLGTEHMRALKLEETIKPLLVMKTPKIEFGSIINTHLLLTLEPLLNELPECKVMGLLEDTLFALPSAISNQQDDIMLHASEYLSDLLSKPTKLEILRRYEKFPKALSEILASLEQLPPHFDETYAAILTLITNMLPFIAADELLVEVFEFSLQTLNQYQDSFCSSRKALGECDTSVALSAINLCKKILRVREAPANVLFEDATNFGTILVKLSSHHSHANLSINEVNRGKLVCYLKTLIQTINCIMCEFTPNSAISDTLIQNLLTISEKFATTSIDVACLQVFKTLQCHSQFDREIKAVFNSPKPEMCMRLARLLKSGKHEESLKVIELFTSLVHIREKVYEMLQEMSSSKPQINSGPTNLLLSQDHQKLLDHSLLAIQSSALAENSEGSILQLTRIKIQSLMQEIETHRQNSEAAQKCANDLHEMLAKSNQEVLLYMDKLIEKENRLQIMEAKLQESKKNVLEFEAQMKVIKKDLTKEHESRLQTERSIQLVRQELLGEKEQYQTLFATYSQLTEDMKHRLDQSKNLEEKLAVYEREATALQHAKKKLEKQCELKDATIKNLESEKEALQDEIKQFTQLQDQITMLMKRNASDRKTKN